MNCDIPSMTDILPCGTNRLTDADMARGLHAAAGTMPSSPG
ncbi:MAG: hypothetical protein ACJ8AW_13325 [Rhodopila sp.]|jgi:hypothetical protein